MPVFKHIADLHFTLCVQNRKYLSLVTARTDEEAVEGELFDDSVCAAQILRRAAGLAGDSGLAGLDLATIREAIDKLIDRREDPEKAAARDRESQEARMALHGLTELPPRPLS